jgi:hypothetical protein
VSICHICVFFSYLQLPRHSTSAIAYLRTSLVDGSDVCVRDHPWWQGVIPVASVIIDVDIGIH